MEFLKIDAKQEQSKKFGRELLCISRKSLRKTRSGQMNSREDDDMVKGSVMERAEALVEILENKSLTFVKLMLPSHVSGGYWLGLPKEFCQQHLSSHDTEIILTDEAGHAYETTYLSGRTGLSGGWRRFSIEHNLLVNDVLVFELVGPVLFKVHILTAKCLFDVDAALGLMKLSLAK